MTCLRTCAISIPANELCSSKVILSKKTNLRFDNEFDVSLTHCSGADL